MEMETKPATDRPLAWCGEGARSLEEANRCLRDLVAISTLPAVWLGAKPLRIAESLLAALDTTVAPALGYIRFHPDASEPPIEIAHFHGVRAPAKFVAALGSELAAWSASHDPDESLLFAPGPGREPLRVSVYPLGINAASGLIAAGFAGPDGPSSHQRTLLNIAATQAMVARRNAAMQRKQELLYEQAAREIADRTQAENALRESEERYRRLFDSIDQGFCTVEVLFDGRGKAVDYRFLLVNPAFERQTGITDAVGRSMREIAPLHEEHWFETYGRIAQTGEAMRFENQAAQLGRDYEVYAWRIGEPAEHKVGILFNDITDRRRAAESERRLSAIVEYSTDAIISIDLDAVIRSWNQGAEQLYGYTGAEAIGKPVSILIPENRENEEPQILERIRRSESVKHYETVRRRKDGTLIDISLTVSPLKDAFGRVVGASKVARDITERVRAREILEQMVAQRTSQLRDTVSELEAFSYSIAHDMRAPLRAMHGYSRILEEDFAEMLPATAKGFLDRIARGAGRLDQLITDVLNYTRITRGDMPLGPVDIEKLTRDIVEIYPNLREAGAAIFIQSPMPQVVGNAAALTQCISNLIGNAVKFVAPGTKPQVRISAEVRHDRVRYSVEDNGIGIGEEAQRRIFRLFQRLNPTNEFEGTGIGLTIVRKAVERMAGQVGVASQPGAGSTFWIELALAK